MRVAGLGFRKAAGVSALRDALTLAGGNVTVLATAETKADAAALVLLAQELGVPIVGVPPDALTAAKVNTHSLLVKALYNTGSVAEAAALAVAGPGAILAGPRVSSRDGMATAAIAERTDE